MIEQDSCAVHYAAALEQVRTSAGDSLSLVTIIDGAARLAGHKRLVALATTGSLLAGVLISFLLPVRYQATTKIMTPQQSQSSAAMLMSQLASSPSGSLVAAAAGSGGLGLKSPNDIYIGLLNSRPVEDAIVEKFGLGKVYGAGDRTAARNALADNTKIASERSGLISVSVTDTDKTRAAGIANAYTEQLRSLSKSLAMTEASERRIFYEEQLGRAKEDLIAAGAAFQQVQKNKGLVQLDAQTRVLIAGLADLRAQKTARQVELDALRSFSTERNPQVQLAEKQLSSLQAEIDRLEQSGYAAGPSGLGFKDVAGAGLEYMRAEHELLYRQTLFDLLIKQYDAAKLDEAKYAAVIQVVEPAIPPDHKSFPHRASFSLGFAFLGFSGSCLYLFLREFSQRHPQLSASLAGLRSALAGR